MASVRVLKRLETTYPGDSGGALEKCKQLNLKDFDVTEQSIVLQDGVRVSGTTGKKKVPDVLYDGADTLYTAFQRGLSISGNGNCLGWRNSGDEGYQWLSYQEVRVRALSFGSGLLKHGAYVGQDTKLGIFSKNRVEWVVAEQAANCFSMIVVPFYDSLSPTACRYICNLTEMKFVICDTEKNASKLMDSTESVPTLKTIIAIEKFSDEFIQNAGEKGIKIVQFRDVEASGSEDPQEAVPPKPEDLCTICFTSGTTGNPKGVILTHSNFISACSGFIITLSKRFEIRTGDVMISYLPLAHVYERFLQVVTFMHGASIGFFRGDPTLLLEDMACLKPTMFPCVPRVMNKLYDKVCGAVSEKNKFSQMVFRKAFEGKKKEVLSGTIRNNGLWDYVFKRIRKLLGGNIRLISTGAAPISPDVKMFFRIIFGCLVLEGYGQTETTAAITITHPDDLSDGHVGTVLPPSLIKLVDAPELDYLAAKGQGEICVKGPAVFKGYFKDPEKTNETLDKDGYCHTGDVGEWLPNGQLKIIDRVKHIFKLSQGEYVAPERVENEYLLTEGVAQIFVHGESLEDCCIAVVVPDEEWVKKEAALRQWEGDFNTLCAKQELNDLLLEKMETFAQSSDLKGFERVKKIHLHSEPFSVENGLLTPTFKSKRPILRKHFKDVLDQMYLQLRENKNSATTTNAQTNGGSSREQEEGVAEDKEGDKSASGEEEVIGEPNGKEAEEKTDNEKMEQGITGGEEVKKRKEETEGTREEGKEGERKKAEAEMGEDEDEEKEDGAG